MKLIVGLGNPGSQYAGTRHNVGFEVLDALAARLGLIAWPDQFDRMARNRFDGLSIDGTALGQKVMLLKPMTYMNASGRVVQQARAFHQLDPSDLMIVLDELALPCGRIRLRAGGSDGGHNGMRDIQRALATQQYPRMRIGIDAPPERIPGRDYVLGRFTPEQRRAIDEVIPTACDALACWIEQGIERAMNRYNVTPATENETRTTDN
jgi:PTH1 family peptidyl-tRNA hydrolase